MFMPMRPVYTYVSMLFDPPMTQGNLPGSMKLGSSQRPHTGYVKVHSMQAGYVAKYPQKKTLFTVFSCRQQVNRVYCRRADKQSACSTDSMQTGSARYARQHAP